LQIVVKGGERVGKAGSQDSAEEKNSSRTRIQFKEVEEVVPRLTGRGGA